jgi:hypothetical protein
VKTAVVRIAVPLVVIALVLAALFVPPVVAVVLGALAAVVAVGWAAHRVTRGRRNRPRGSSVTSRSGGFSGLRGGRKPGGRSLGKFLPTGTGRSRGANGRWTSGPGGSRKSSGTKSSGARSSGTGGRWPWSRGKRTSAGRSGTSSAFGSTGTARKTGGRTATTSTGRSTAPRTPSSGRPGGRTPATSRTSGTTPRGTKPATRSGGGSAGTRSSGSTGRSTKSTGHASGSSGSTGRASGASGRARSGPARTSTYTTARDPLPSSARAKERDAADRASDDDQDDDPRPGLLARARYRISDAVQSAEQRLGESYGDGHAVRALGEALVQPLRKPDPHPDFEVGIPGPAMVYPNVDLDEPPAAPPQVPPVWNEEYEVAVPRKWPDRDPDPAPQPPTPGETTMSNDTVTSIIDADSVAQYADHLGDLSTPESRGQCYEAAANAARLDAQRSEEIARQLRRSAAVLEAMKGPKPKAQAAEQLEEARRASVDAVNRLDVAAGFSRMAEEARAELSS